MLHNRAMLVAYNDYTITVHLLHQAHLFLAACRVYSGGGDTEPLAGLAVHLAAGGGKLE